MLTYPSAHFRVFVQNDPNTAGQWFSLGTYRFNAGTSGNVTLTRETGTNGTTSADAIRFVSHI
ncbi:MAG: hypothetical protein HQ553_17370 [Chloroflexi bacterium]|nr:hypothetical protein [Chloroflexota bacterium]